MEWPDGLAVGAEAGKEEDVGRGGDRSPKASTQKSKPTKRRRT